MGVEAFNSDSTSGTAGFDYNNFLSQLGGTMAQWASNSLSRQITQDNATGQNQQGTTANPAGAAKSSGVLANIMGNPKAMLIAGLVVIVGVWFIFKRK